MRASMRGVTLVLALAMVFVTIPAESAGAKRVEPVVVAERGSAVVTDGEHVVWVTYPDGDVTNGDIYGMRLDDGVRFPIAIGPGNHVSPNISSGIVVWVEDDQREACDACQFEIRGKNLYTGEEFVIARSPDRMSRPSISGDVVIWEQWNSNGLSIQGRSITTMDPALTLATPRAPGRGQPIIDGDRLVWEEIIDGAFSIYTARPGDDTELVGSGSPIGAGASFGFDIAGDTIVHIDALWNMVITNVVTRETRSFPISPYDQDLTFDGRYIVWQDHRDDEGWGLRGYDLMTDSDFTVVSDGTNQFSPDLQAGTLVWVSGDTTGQVLAAPISDLLPSAPVSDPGFTNANGLWFPETDHTLSWGFRGFWERSGGLPIFGYPVTEEYHELNSDTGEHLTVQYFERQRFEWHPEHQGGPYEVQLGRLGYEDALQRRLLATAPFLPAPVGPLTEGCVLFSETQHHVCDAFLSYWESSGLDLGDEGVSYRESLALFGYPLSEPYTDPHTGLTIQHFERAIYELHPENNASHRVLLRRLGAEEIAKRGW